MANLPASICPLHDTVAGKRIAPDNGEMFIRQDQSNPPTATNHNKSLPNLHSTSTPYLKHHTISL